MWASATRFLPAQNADAAAASVVDKECGYPENCRSFVGFSKELRDYRLSPVVLPGVSSLMKTPQKTLDKCP
jgi:hypothetical protein